jgi:hypothetical protein
MDIEKFILRLKRKENPEVHSSCHGTVNTEITRNQVSRELSCISVVKIFVACENCSNNRP